MCVRDNVWISDTPHAFIFGETCFFGSLCLYGIAFFLDVGWGVSYPIMQVLKDKFVIVCVFDSEPVGIPLTMMWWFLLVSYLICAYYC